MKLREASVDEFVEYPYKLYKNSKNWVGDLKGNAKKIISLSHPFWNYAQRKIFVVEENNKIIGRIAAIENFQHNRFWNERCCFFGFFDCEDNIEASNLLFQAVELFAKERGLNIIRGPANPSSNYVWGLLVENFDEPNCIMMPYNYSYYEKLITNNGFIKEKDLYAYEWKDTKNDFIDSLYERIKKSNEDISIEAADLKNFKKVFEDIKNVYNKAWEKNWGFVPMSDEEIEEMAKELRPILKNDFLIFARNKNGEAIGFSLILPDLNIVLSPLKGKITPINIFIALYRYFFKIDKGRVLTLGINSEYRGRGIEVLIIKRAIEIAKKYGWKKGELSWTLEDNIKINRTIEKFGGKLYKKYRIFRKDI